MDSIKYRPTAEDLKPPVVDQNTSKEVLFATGVVYLYSIERKPSVVDHSPKEVELSRLTILVYEFFFQNKHHEVIDLLEDLNLPKYPRTLYDGYPHDIESIGREGMNLICRDRNMNILSEVEIPYGGFSLEAIRFFKNKIYEKLWR